MESTIKQTFTASDGETFDTPVEAERHSIFTERKAAFDNAWTLLREATIEAYKTADGYDFVDSQGSFFRDRCYLVRDKYFSLHPSIMEINLYPSSIRSIEVEEDGVKFTANYYDGRNHQEIRFDLSDLYKKKKNAEKEVVSILKSNIESCERRIEELTEPK